MQGLLTADTAGPKLYRLYHLSSLVLAGAVPAGFLVSDGSTTQRLADVTLGVVIPFHAHYSMNGVVSDYIPPKLQRPARYGLAGVSGVMALGLLKLNLLGPGVTRSIKQFWKNE